MNLVKERLHVRSSAYSASNLRSDFPQYDQRFLPVQHHTHTIRNISSKFLNVGPSVPPFLDRNVSDLADQAYYLLLATSVKVDVKLRLGWVASFKHKKGQMLMRDIVRTDNISSKLYTIGALVKWSVDGVTVLVGNKHVPRRRYMSVKGSLCVKDYCDVLCAIPMIQVERNECPLISVIFERLFGLNRKHRTPRRYIHRPNIQGGIPVRVKQLSRAIS